MRYEVVGRGDTVEAITAHSGYRIRMSLHKVAVGFRVEVRIRGSESEEEVAVDMPGRAFANDREAFDYGYEHAV